jgi:hypothetical protein
MSVEATFIALPLLASWSSAERPIEMNKSIGVQPWIRRVWHLQGLGVQQREQSDCCSGGLLERPSSMLEQHHLRGGGS